MTLSSAWTAFMEKGQQPLAPEDYIEVEKIKRRWNKQQ